MDENKLAALRAKYSGAGAEDVQNPEYRKVVDILFSETGRRAKPFEGISTFLDLNIGAMDALDALDVAIVGVPMDLGVSNRPGARLGPRAVRQIERVGPYHEVHRTVPMRQARAADIGDVPFESRYSLETCHADIEAFFSKLVDAEVRPLAVGGDHSISLPILKAVGRDGPVGMIHIDAHCDTGAALEGSKFHHGGPFRQAVLDGVLDPERTIQIGIRGNAEFIWEFSGDSGMTVVHADTFVGQGVAATIEQMRDVVGDGPTYISFDVDALDPVFAPGTGTPEIGGLSSREAMALVRGAMGLNIIGGDVVEVAPQYDATTNTAHVGAQMLFEIFAVLAAAEEARQAV